MPRLFGHFAILLKYEIFKCRKYMYGSAQHNIQKMSGDRNAILFVKQTRKTGPKTGPKTGYRHKKGA